MNFKTKKINGHCYSVCFLFIVILMSRIRNLHKTQAQSIHESLSAGNFEQLLKIINDTIQNEMIALVMQKYY